MATGVDALRTFHWPKLTEFSWNYSPPREKRLSIPVREWRQQMYKLFEIQGESGNMGIA